MHAGSIISINMQHYTHAYIYIYTRAPQTNIVNHCATVVLHARVDSRRRRPLAPCQKIWQHTSYVTCRVCCMDSLRLNVNVHVTCVSHMRMRQLYGWDQSMEVPDLLRSLWIGVAKDCISSLRRVCALDR